MMNSRHQTDGIKPYSSIALRNRFRMRLQKKGSQLGADDATKLIRSNSEKFQYLVNAFYIYGEYPWEKSNESRLLFSYPETDFSAGILAPFCLPDGVNRQISTCDLQSTVYDQGQIANSQFFTLYFPENKDAPYLFCLRYRANPLTVPSICHNLTLCELLEKTNIRGMPYCDQCIAVKSKLPYHEFFEKFMKWFLKCEMVARMMVSNELDNFLSANIISENEFWPEQHREDLFNQLMSFLYLPVPQINESICIDQSPYPVFNWTIPNTLKSYYPIAIRCIFDLVKNLDIKKFWQLFSALLLERSILIYHPNQSVVCNVILALHYLIKPLRWVFSSISQLPPSLTDILNAPNPFIIGTILDVQYIEKEWVYVDLQQKNIITGDEILIHPKKDRFCNQFYRSYNEINNSESPTLIDILESCNGIVNEMVGMLYSSIITDFSDPFNVQSKFFEEIYLQHFPTNERHYMEVFSSSQMVMMFTEQLCRRKSDEMKQAGSYHNQ
ncbi:hypothetical protein TRFO_41100 [Tritrichomonas foetus]|uniref:UDENN domain-containing protein n=1 Tax=Tritrichomonas foetus TaxID=1144522 RepID=A0A1J4L5Y5_9EUKA|nr:hypothetical protein TRFO_41100 [Tritrichomonas foetus]|eukprot:OHT17357.1 hypothetical protein TRFO_41100 [Tritrichomonas foetus]